MHIKWALRLAIVVTAVVSLLIGATRVTVADGGIEQRIADFWNRVNAMQPGDYLSSNDLGQWALNVIERDSTTRITVADFRAATAGMQTAMDRAGHSTVVPGPTPVRTVSPVLSGLSRQNPAGPGASLPITVSSLGKSYDFAVSLQAVIRGVTANQMVKAANMFNADPKPGMEYLVASIRFVYVKGPGSDISYDASDYDFDVISTQGTQYESPFCVSPTPKFGAKLYPGGASEGWACFMVQQNDPQPTLTFGRNYDGSGGRWWRLGW